MFSKGIFQSLLDLGAPCLRVLEAVNQYYPSPGLVADYLRINLCKFQTYSVDGLRLPPGE